MTSVPCDAPDRSSPAGTAQAGRLDLLAGALAFQPPLEATARLRLQLLSGADIWQGLLESASDLRLLPALAWRLSERRLVPPTPTSSATGGHVSPGQSLALATEQHRDRRAGQRQSLVAIVGSLNAAGIEPILLKGARAVWTDSLPWRTLRDLDLLVPGDAAVDANNILLRNGYAPLPDAQHRSRRHHLDLLFRHDLPGWVEIHRRGGNPYAEPFLPTAELVSLACRDARQEGTVRLIPPAAQLWHGVIHHGFGHSGFARGTIDLKGVFEFAAGWQDLRPDERQAVTELAARNACGLAMLDLWRAAAVDWLALPDAADLPIPQDARQIWQAMRRRVTQDEPRSGHYPGYREILRLASSRSRTRRVNPKPTLGHFGAVVQSIRRLLPRVTRPE